MSESVMKKNVGNAGEYPPRLPLEARRSDGRTGDRSADIPRRPTVSIIVPVYNTAPYLSKCLDSLLAQTLPAERLEIIVVDDGSTDSSGALADQYAAAHENIRVLHQPNAGSSAARNAGIDAAAGDYLGFVDSDDAVAPGMYAALLDVIGRTGVKMAQTGREEFAEDGTKLPAVVQVPGEECFIMAEEMLFSLLLHEGDASFCTKLTARALFDGAAASSAAGKDASVDGGRLRFPEKELNEDFHLLVRMLERIDKLAALPRADYRVCYRTGSNSRRESARTDYFPPVFTDIVRNADFAMALVREKHPGILPAAKRFALVQRLDYLLHIPVPQMRRDNAFYRGVVRYVRKNRAEIILNPYLSAKERRNLWLLSLAPKTLRALHKRIKGL